MNFDTLDLGGPQTSFHVSGLLENFEKKIELVIMFGKLSNNGWALDIDSKKWRKIGIYNLNLVYSAYVCTGPSLLYVFGGHLESNSLISNLIFKYNHKTESLTEIYIDPESFSPALTRSAAVQYMGYIYIYGGIDSNGVYCSNMYRFHIKEKKWDQVLYDEKQNKAPVGRCGHSMNIWIRKRGKKATPFLVISGGYLDYTGVSDDSDMIILYNLSKKRFEFINRFKFLDSTRDQNSNEDKFETN